ncbi:MAG TPA: SUMF1/EgtB/PvdO family nonheme iron enzyme, partial [Candidatus Sulfomarinibacteraceae bacterium]|nr:SUMF1/EgtB/PvdO family nonheme iron enzyme [Candidatus Sulfomarinibacteraceae bacterium]
MIDSRGWRRPGPWSVAVLLIALAPPAAAGPWSQLPEAVNRLEVRSGDREAEQVIRSAEDSLAAQARAGRLTVVHSLFDTYATLVSNLDDGRSRVAALEDRIARILLVHGDDRRQTDLGAAVRSWALAAELDPGSMAVARLRSVFEPPEDADPGQVWRSPVDGAALVFHPAMAVRVGCTARDGACLEDEVYFRWVEVPALWVEAREVSNARYRRCVEAGFCDRPADPKAFDDPRLADHPVVGVSWRQARAFARWAGRRLPSEAEWERAARGEVTDARFPWGNGRKPDLANVWTGPRDSTLGGTRPGGSFPATGFGLFDVAGNVWEWCQDRYRARFSEDIEGGGAARGGWGRVVRGGSWRWDLDMARVSARLWYDPDHAADDLGFRCVLGHPGGVPVAELVQVAARAFRVPVAASAFDQADLEEEDRRYLERRAITLLVVEGRM